MVLARCVRRQKRTGTPRASAQRVRTAAALGKKAQTRRRRRRKPTILFVEGEAVALRVVGRDPDRPKQGSRRGTPAELLDGIGLTRVRNPSGVAPSSPVSASGGKRSLAQPPDELRVASRFQRAGPTPSGASRHGALRAPTRVHASVFVVCRSRFEVPGLLVRTRGARVSRPRLLVRQRAARVGARRRCLGGHAIHTHGRRTTKPPGNRGPRSEIRHVGPAKPPP